MIDANGCADHAIASALEREAGADAAGAGLGEGARNLGSEAVGELNNRRVGARAARDYRDRNRLRVARSCPRSLLPSLTLPSSG